MAKSINRIGLILGGAKTVWSDLERAQAVIGDTPAIIVATNCAGWQYPGHLDAWCTLHPERFAGWRAQREAARLNTDYQAFTNVEPPAEDDDAEGEAAAPDYECLHDDARGSTGLYAAKIALKRLDCDLAILCGVPMDDTGEHIHWPRPWTHAHLYRPAFEAAQAAGLIIRSMSGWTAELFGMPHDLFGKVYQEGEGMAWVVFSEDFDYCPTITTTIGYKAGPERRHVREECAAKAVSLGRATRVPAPSRSELAGG